MKISFKIVLACVCAAGTMNGFSQTEQYFRPSLNGGISTIQYSADEISPKLFAPTSIGGGVTAEYIMFFNQYVGASAGIGVSMFQRQYELNTTLNTSLPYYFVEEQKSKDFTYNAKFENWEERQMIHTIDIPVGAVGKYSFSETITGMAGLGVKFQIPVKATYKVSEDGTRTTTGYYKETNSTLKDIPHQGFYTLNGGQEGDLNTKSISFATYLDLGVMQKIKSQTFYYGIYGQFGFSKVNAEPETDFLTQYGAYNSPLNTTAIEKSRLLSFGIKIGYVLPVKINVEEVDSIDVDSLGADSLGVDSIEADSLGSDSDSVQSSLKPELDDHPYTTATSDSYGLSAESTQGTVQTESSVVTEEKPAKEGNVFKRFFSKFKKKDKKKKTDK